MSDSNQNLITQNYGSLMAKWVNRCWKYDKDAWSRVDTILTKLWSDAEHYVEDTYKFALGFVLIINGIYSFYGPFFNNWLMGHSAYVFLLMIKFFKNKRTATAWLALLLFFGRLEVTFINKLNCTDQWELLKLLKNWDVFLYRISPRKDLKDIFQNTQDYYCFGLF